MLPCPECPLSTPHPDTRQAQTLPFSEASLLQAHCTHIYNHKYDNSLEEDTLNFVYLIL